MSTRHNLMSPNMIATAMLILTGTATAQAPAPTQNPGMGRTAQPGSGTTPERRVTLTMTGTQPSSTAGAAIGTPASPGFVREFAATHYLASRLDGADVFTVGGTDKVADIADAIISDRGDVIGIVLAYGGLAGIAQSYVAVEPAALRMRRVSDTETRVETTLTADQLKNAPRFDYSARPR